MAQPQLFKIPLDTKDIVYTPDWVARDMVEFFKPSGRILEPSKGGGAFMKYLPANTMWCEIEEGKDFYAWNEEVDWCFGNPPYTRLAQWIRHSFTFSLNIVYLIPLHYLWVSTRIIKDIRKYGGIVHKHIYPETAFKDWSLGFAVGAVHFKKGYSGPMSQSIVSMPSNTAWSGLVEGGGNLPAEVVVVENRGLA
jgi:hypothetical protein